jgi:hypothetical protein
MGFEFFIYILRWVTKLIGKICDLPPAHPCSYFMTSPLLALPTLVQTIQDYNLGCSANRRSNNRRMRYPVMSKYLIFPIFVFQIPLKGAYLYDAVIQFAAALHELREAGQKTTGKNIVNRLKGRHFIGMTRIQ